MRVFDLKTGKQVGLTLAAFSGPSFPVEFTGDRLVTADADRLVSWQFADLAPSLATVLPPSDPGSKCPLAGCTIVPRFMPDGRQIMTVTQDDHVAARWNAADGKPLGPFLAAHAKPGWRDRRQPRRQHRSHRRGKR